GKEQTAELNSGDLFPALHLKYSINEKQNLLFSSSRTVTRPSFIEMAPFEYKESYGGSAVRGYADLQNGYNYNVDLRYEFYPAAGELISLSGYYKFLDSPIERVQEYAGAAINTFRNVDRGQVAGVEAEYRKNILDQLRFGLNASYIYTKIVLPEGGIYTDKNRALQGASPYLINADLNWSPIRKGDKDLSLALVYNLRGPRISSVGINGVGNVVEEAFHALDLNAVLRLNPKMQFKFSAKNILNQASQFKQEIADTGKNVLVEKEKRGASFSLGFNYNF
ncbi:MAG: TonB-dependent receptor domain-containing protein, partial [Bacteroidales bacterium]